MTPDRPAILIALGSNIDAARNLAQAVELLGEGLEVLASSSVYESDPVGAPGAPAFLNAVLRVAPTVGPRSLKFGLLRPIERRLGRRRSRDRNAPRTIDLDLLLYGSEVESAVDLTLPDPDLLLRAHVAIPAAEVAGEARHPVDGRTLAEIAAALPSRLRQRPDVAIDESSQYRDRRPGC